MFTLRSQNGIRLSAYVCLRKNNWFRELAAEQGLHVRHLDCFLPTLKDKRHCDGNRLGATAGAWLNPGAKNGCGAYYVFAFLFIYVRSGGGEIAAQESVPTWLCIFSCILGFFFAEQCTGGGTADLRSTMPLSGEPRRATASSRLLLKSRPRATGKLSIQMRWCAHWRENFPFKCGGDRLIGTDQRGPNRLIQRTGGVCFQPSQPPRQLLRGGDQYRSSSLGPPPPPSFLDPARGRRGEEEG